MRPGPGRPRGSTRERILDVALELFTEQGYEQTSLREVADQLGVTKAALYYHFEKKEDILLALHLRLHALGSKTFARLVEFGGPGLSADSFVAVLDEFIDQVMANRTLFLFHLRNEQALRSLQASDHNDQEHQDLHEQLQLLLGSSVIPLPVRVRMACAIGAVMSALMGSSEVFKAVPAEELAALVRAAVRDLMDLGDSPKAPDPPLP